MVHGVGKLSSDLSEQALRSFDLDPVSILHVLDRTGSVEGYGAEPIRKNALNISDEIVRKRVASDLDLELLKASQRIVTLMDDPLDFRGIIKNWKGHFALVQQHVCFVDAAGCHSRDALIRKPNRRSLLRLDRLKGKLVKDEATLPVKVQLFWDRQFKVRKMLFARSEHASALNISVLLYFVLGVTSEKHRK